MYDEHIKFYTSQNEITYRYDLINLFIIMLLLLLYVLHCIETISKVLLCLICYLLTLVKIYGCEIHFVVFGSWQKG